MDKIKQNLSNLIKELLPEVNNIEVEITVPQNSEFGDLTTNIAMKLSKELKQNPLNIAKEIAAKLRDKSAEMGINKIEIVKPGFINFYINNSIYSSIIDEVISKGENYGINDDWAKKTILIEHTSPNPNKEYHLGTFKNTVTGLSLSYLFEAMGAKVIRDCINNNRGIAIAKLMWGYLKFAKKNESSPTDLAYWYDHQDEWKTPEDVNLPPSRFIDQLYVKGSDDFKSSEEIEQNVRQLVIDWEAEEPKNWALWQLTQDWVWQGFKQALTRVGGWKFDKIWNESDIYKDGKAHVERGLQEGIFRKLDDGAVLSDLKSFKLPDTILIKNDGTSLYITQDLELSNLKRKTFNPDEMYWVIGPEQSLAMKQMFAISSQLGFGKYEDFHHMAYGFILIKDKDGKPKKMSSRGEFKAYVNDILDDAKVEIIKYIKKEGLSEADVDNIAEKVAIGAMKYSLLKVGRTQDVVFDFGTTISFEGDSGPYIMYTYSRAKSILSQASNLSDIGNYTFATDEELEICRIISKFGDSIKSAATEYSPNLIASSIFQLAQAFNKFYTKYSVLNADSEEIKNARLRLTAATAQVLKNGLNLLGIETVERM
jgi:arginyl-tRNA synthetase